MLLTSQPLLLPVTVQFILQTGTPLSVKGGAKTIGVNAHLSGKGGDQISPLLGVVSKMHSLIRDNGNSCFPFRFWVFFGGGGHCGAFWPHLQLSEVPRPGIKSMPQQQPEPQQGQRQTLNPLGPQGALSFRIF